MNAMLFTTEEQRSAYFRRLLANPMTAEYGAAFDLAHTDLPVFVDFPAFRRDCAILMMFELYRYLDEHPEHGVEPGYYAPDEIIDNAVFYTVFSAIRSVKSAEQDNALSLFVESLQPRSVPELSERQRELLEDPYVEILSAFDWCPPEDEPPADFLKQLALEA